MKVTAFGVVAIATENHRVGSLRANNGNDTVISPKAKVYMHGWEWAVFLIFS